jgi:hypothetical protein
LQTTGGVQRDTLVMMFHEVISYPGNTAVQRAKPAERVICPTGCLVIWLSSPVLKNISLRA